ncbi:glycosyltransferase [Cyanobacterium aponinum FACHB-4101]|uniref:glycosyltransferase n=1 Tax=Cyanobacterium aponinum TaxID=379064 RepID=UPI001680E24C|nr:glycosyltransferase [Cyanobacterium aponinum]MBD2394964.1 glycosyltransferase [Cyanobacterium aponinum FACHB-4101]
MKFVFAHDHRFIPIDSLVYSESQFGLSLWVRYLKHFEQIIVTARQGSLPNHKKKENLVLSSLENVDFKFLPNLSNFKNQLTKRNSSLKLMNDYVKEADGVIARLPSEIGLLAIQAAILNHKPWAVEVVGCPWDGLWNYGNLQGKIYAPILTWRMKQAVKKSRFSLYVTDQFLQQRYPSPQGKTINCSDVEISPPSKTVLEQRLNKIEQNGEKKVIFGLIGTLKGKFKGIQTVLRTLQQIRSQLPPFEFRVLGGGEADSWRQLAQSLGVNDVTFFDGTLPGGEPVFQWLDKIDIYLQPSFKEGLPRALIEAMSRGCPCLASNVAGIPELLESESLITPGNINQLGQLLIKVANHRHWQLQQAQKNWQRAGDYAYDVLEQRRDNFWQTFVESINQK